jgi:putative N-acetyltransferase (TIGR04045 family)
MAVAEIVCCAVRDAEGLDAHFAIRRAVFVDEQGLFPESDRDDRDRDPRTIHLLGLVNDRPCGAVRLYPLDDAGEVWQGDRLAVLNGERTHGLGSPLVRLAVATAGELGGVVMHAHIQLPNVRFFESLGWHRAGDEETYVGVTHMPMTIALSGGGVEVVTAHAVAPAIGLPSPRDVGSSASITISH